MPAFVYTARTASGELKSATIEAASKEDVTNQLKRQRMTVVKIEEAAKSKRRGLQFNKLVPPGAD